MDKTTSQRILDNHGSITQNGNIIQNQNIEINTNVDIEKNIFYFDFDLNFWEDLIERFKKLSINYLATDSLTFDVCSSLLLELKSRKKILEEQYCDSLDLILNLTVEIKNEQLLLNEYKQKVEKIIIKFAKDRNIVNLENSLLKLYKNYISQNKSNIKPESKMSLAIKKFEKMVTDIENLISENNKPNNDFINKEFNEFLIKMVKQIIEFILRGKRDGLFLVSKNDIYYSHKEIKKLQFIKNYIEIKLLKDKPIYLDGYWDASDNIMFLGVK